MTDDAKCYAATPAATLEQHITDSRVPKNEAEWWAYHEIGRLREENARYKLAYAEYVEATDRMNGTPCEQIRHQQEVEALREENARLREAVKAAYYEGWQDRESIIATGERLDFDWNCSEARYAIREGGKD